MNNIEIELMEIMSYILINLGYSENVIDSITPDTDLLVSGVMDSVVMAELIMEIEERFDVELDIDDITPENYGTICSIAKSVNRVKDNKNAI